MKLTYFASLASPWSTTLALQPCAKTDNQSVSTLYQFPNGSWVENLAIRSNGKILATLLSSPEVWQIDPARPGSAELIYRFPHALSALGIAEVYPDVFTVAIGNISLPAIASEPGSYSAWTIDLSRRKHGKDVKRVTKITDLPQAEFLNGMSILPGQPSSVLLADSAQGVIYQLDTKSGASKVWLDNAALKPNASVPVKSGINGLKACDGHVYFTNTFSAPVLARIPINRAGDPSGPVETIVGEPSFGVNIGDHADDIAHDSHGNIWLATDPSNSIVKVSPGGDASVAVGGTNDPIVAGVTALAFARTSRDRGTLYATTNGGFAYPVGGRVGGKVLVIPAVGAI